ncbi:MAG: ABC transporter ATP-binding protein [Gammaproteobacteria bacterium]
MSLLSTRQLSVSIGGRTLCENLDLSITAGQTWAVLGANGAGKTTLLHTLAGLHPAAAGEINYLDRPLASWSARALACIRGILLQDSQDAFPATVLETVLTGRHPYLRFWEFEGAADQALAESLLQDVELQAMAMRRTDTLSGGERRRLAIATLLAQNPQIFLLDEPANHLDLRRQLVLLELMQERCFAKQGALLMSLHDINMALRMCSHALLLFENETLAGPVAEVLTLANIEKLYGCRMKTINDNGTLFYWPV